jgi:uncharacterized membrane protein YhaH (DUF805 family)
MEGTMDLANLYTTFDGRISRQPFWIGMIALTVVMIVLLYIVSFAGAGFVARLIVFIIQLAFLYPSAAVMVKRLHDRDKPGWYAAILLGLSILNGLTNLFGLTGNPLDPNALDFILGLAVLVVAIWFLIELGFLRGTAGPNQYGPDPLAGSI